MSNKIKTLALLPILSLILTACTLADLPLIGGWFGESETTITDDPVTITIWGLWEDPTVMAKLIESYNQVHPNVTINYEDRSIMSLEEYKERIFSRLSDSSASEIDIALVHNSWVSRLSPVLSSMPSSLMTLDQYREKYYPVIEQSGVVDNNIHAIPSYYDGLVLVYNREHFDEVNQNLPPTAWEEFRRLALELTIRGDKQGLVRAGAAMGSANNIDHFSDILGLMWAQADVGVTSAMREKTNYSRNEQYNSLLNELDSAPAYDAVTFYTNFLTEDRVWDPGFPEATAAFVNGQVSMIFVPSWQVLDIVRSMPNASAIGVAPVPQAIPQDPRSWGTFWMYTVPNNSPNSAVAWDFLNFISSDEQQLLYSNAVSEVRIISPAFANVTMAQEVTNPFVVPVLDSAPYARSSEFASRSGNTAQNEALRSAVNAILNGGNPKEVMTTVKTELQSQ